MACVLLSVSLVKLPLKSLSIPQQWFNICMSTVYTSVLKTKRFLSNHNFFFFKHIVLTLRLQLLTDKIARNRSVIVKKKKMDKWIKNKNIISDFYSYYWTCFNPDIMKEVDKIWSFVWVLSWRGLTFHEPARLYPSEYKSKQVVWSVDLTGHLTANVIGRLPVKPWLHGLWRLWMGAVCFDPSFVTVKSVISLVSLSVFCLAC